MAESKFRVVSHIFYDKCDTLSLRFQLICILRPPIPEVNDDVAAVCKFNDAGNVKLESHSMGKYDRGASLKLFKISLFWSENGVK